MTTSQPLLGYTDGDEPCGGYQLDDMYTPKYINKPSTTRKLCMIILIILTGIVFALFTVSVVWLTHHHKPSNGNVLILNISFTRAAFLANYLFCGHCQLAGKMNLYKCGINLYTFNIIFNKYVIIFNNNAYGRTTEYETISTHISRATL